MKLLCWNVQLTSVPRGMQVLKTEKLERNFRTCQRYTAVRMRTWKVETESKTTKPKGLRSQNLKKKVCFRLPKASVKADSGSRTLEHF